MLSVLLIILGILLIILGIIGCFLPVIPGPPLNYLALILLSIARNWEPFSGNFLLTWALITLAVVIIDYIVPAFGAKKYGASKLGIGCSVLGMIIGLIFFPPWGMLVGSFLGAIIGEMIAGKQSDAALRASIGVLIGTIFGIGIKLAASGIMTFYFFDTLI
ncbi:DUF456 domain-containing protein [candidate division KSB1 bacterium]|nr:DUF456 domain-containing protein [candidate division KSB1 bacterium]